MKGRSRVLAFQSDGVTIGYKLDRGHTLPGDEAKGVAGARADTEPRWTTDAEMSEGRGGRNDSMRRGATGSGGRMAYQQLRSVGERGGADF